MVSLVHIFFLSLFTTGIEILTIRVARNGFFPKQNKDHLRKCIVDFIYGKGTVAETTVCLSYTKFILYNIAITKSNLIHNVIVHFKIAILEYMGTIQS